MKNLALSGIGSGGFLDRTIDLVGKYLPDPNMILILGPILLIYTCVSAVFAGYLRSKKNVRTPYTRKIFHFLVFTMAGILHLSAGPRAVVLFGIIASASVLYAVLRGKGFPFYEAMARETDAPHRTFFILLPLFTTALGGGLSLLLFPRFAFIGYFVGGWGDAIGEPVGTRWGNHRYRVPSLLGVRATRSLEGSMSVCCSGALVAFIGLMLRGEYLIPALSVAMACGIVGAVVEAFSSHGLDNLTIQLAASAVAFFLLG